MNRRWIAHAALVFAVFTVAGCASGPKYAEMQSTIPVVAAERGRIYFYRSGSMLGAALQPTIKLNGNAVGESKPGGFFYVDATPGNQEVITGTEVDRKLTFTLEKGQTRYVKTTVGFGVMVGRVYPELIDPAVGDKEVKETSYIGAPMMKK
jgi:hypothetical protein